MENREQQILSDIKSMMASIRSQLELLDAKMAELQQVVDPEDFDNAPIDLNIDMVEPVLVNLPEEHIDNLPMPEPEAEIEAEIEQDLEPGSELVLETESILELETSEGPSEAEKVQQAEAVEAQPKEAVIDAMTAKHPWRTDMPGTAVKDIRSAISLNDRIIFINYLYDEDPMAFQNSLTKINTMSSLDEVLEYIDQEHPDWNLESEVVYRFMMAVRRRIR